MLRPALVLLACLACRAEPAAKTSDDVMREILGATDANAQVEVRAPLAFEALRRWYDLDRDWVITSAEMPARDWVRFDRNRDERLTLDDFPSESGELLERVERSLDRRLAEPALEGVLGSLDAFVALDADKDGALSRMEFERALPRAEGVRDPFSALLALARSWDDDVLSLDEWRVLIAGVRG